MKSRVLIVAIFILTLLFPLSVSAQENLGSGKNITLTKDQTINRDYFAAGESVTIDGTVKGDAYIAGGNVTVNGTVDGDLLAAGGIITINGTVKGDARVAGGNINVYGTVDKNVTLLGGSLNTSPTAQILGSVTTAGGNINLLGSVGKEVNIAGGQITLGGKVGSDVQAAAESVNLNSDTAINGNLLYWSKNKARIDSLAQISGKVTQRIPPEVRKPDYEIARRAGKGFSAFFNIIGFLTALVMGSLFIKMLPVYSNHVAESMPRKWLMYIGVGLLAIAVTPILVIVLFMTVIGSPVGVIWLMALGFGLWFAKIFVAMAIGSYATKALKQSWNSYASFALGLAIYYVIGMIPVLGWMFRFFATLAGFGALMLTEKAYYIDLRKKKLI